MPVLTPFVKKYGYNDDKYLGIVRFAFDFCNGLNPEYGIAPMHFDMLKTFLDDSPNKTKYDRMFCYLTFRDSAKTTWFGVIVPTYFACMNGDIWFKNYNLPPILYNVIKGKSAGAAEKTTNRIIDNLMNDKIRSVFGNKIPSVAQVRDKQGKVTSKLMILNDGFIIEALSIGRQTRGTNIKDMRPQYICFDDPEDKSNTKTEERRNSNIEDLFNETIPAMDTKTGRLVYICNLVHQDCIGSHLMKNPQWIRRKYSLSYRDKNGVEKATWEKRFPMETVNRMREFYKAQPKKGGLKAFYMEYYNKIVSDSNPVYKTDFEYRYVHKNGVNFLVKNGKYINVYVTVGYDPAQSEKTRSSDSAIVVCAMDSEGNKYVLDWFVGKLDLHDKYEEKITPVYPFALSNNDLEYVWKRGGIEEVCRFIVKYNADAYCVEIASQQGGIFDDIRARLDAVTPDFLASKGYTGRSLRTTVGSGYTPHIDKVQKLSASIMRDYEAGIITVINPRPELKNVVETFPDNKLDILDAQFLADRMLIPPNKIEYDPINLQVAEEIVDVPEYNSEEAWIVQ